MTRDELQKAIAALIADCLGCCPIGLVERIMQFVDRFCDGKPLPEDGAALAWE